MTKNESHEPQLPKGWIWTALGNLVLEISPGFPSGKWGRDREHGVPHMRPMNIDVSGKLDLTNIKYVHPERNPLAKGDVLFNNTNSPKLVGKTTYINEDTNWAYSNHMTRIRPSHFLDPGYVSHFLHHLYLKGFFLVNCVHHVNQASIDSSFLKEKVLVPLAPLAEQTRIVARLEELFARLDAGVKGLGKVKAQLKRYRQAVLKYAFEGKLTEKWRETHRDQIELAQALFQRIKEERISKGIGQWKEGDKINPKDLSEMPSSWIWVRAQEVCENITNGYTPSAPELHDSGGIPFIKVHNLTFTGKLDFSKNMTFIDKNLHENMLKRSKVFPGDVLINIVGPPLGKVSIVPNLYPEWNINQAIVFFRPLEGYNRAFLALCLQADSITSQLTNQAKATAGQFNISVNMSRNLPIPLPPREEQDKIVFEIKKCFDTVERVDVTMSESMSRANCLRNSVLKAAFAGLLVPQDPSDESAEKLLERIKAERTKSKDEKVIIRRKKEPKQSELSTYVE